MGEGEKVNATSVLFKLADRKLSVQLVTRMEGDCQKAVGSRLQVRRLPQSFPMEFCWVGRGQVGPQSMVPRDVTFSNRGGENTLKDRKELV